MKIKALFVAPYAAMENLIEECREEEHELDLQILIGNLQEGVKLAKQAKAEGFNVIISRGGTAKRISEEVDIPVIDVHVSGYDMLRVLTLANDFPRKKAIVGFPAITGGAKAIIDLLDIPIDMFTIHDEDETEALLRKLKQEGYQLIMGDVVTFETASRLGLLGILIQSGRESIFDAFKEAKTVSRWMTKSRLEIDRLKGILHTTARDVMVLSEQGDVVYEQWTDFSFRPVAEIPFEKDVIQGGSSGPEIIHTADQNGQPIKLITTRMVIHESPYLVCEFSRYPVHQAAHEKVKILMQPAPLIIHQSEAMNTCLTMIHRSLSYSQFIFIGGRGTGKKMLARYVHDQKFHGEGLFASVKAADLLSMSPEEIDAEIRTLYIHSFGPSDDELKNVRSQTIDALKGRGVTLIFSMTEEHPFGENRIYEDEMIRIHIPDLAERKEDLRELVTSSLLHFSQTLGTSAIRITEKGLALLADYRWPGNISELKALLQEAVILEKGYVIEHPLIERLLNRKGVETAVISSGLLSGSLEQIEKRIIEKVLEEEGFNQTKAAKRLNINRSTLWRKLKD
ncbi:sigma-54-dependent Fis family transcriptional regulator [Paenibacillus sp. J23TS9]|uniref:sigma-54-dependent transcriptional regulator n=1 Tax=Paenibacillus sp. J23TS9 TaxID=2807193 RepID=UPI001B210525|nr:sigma-54-dependent transcriptional regulator [Paenibacillus sp. J23TS9]GIP29009.1 sigma-54-dependent Fis family transcriptional regulator [Paenibacillus sp. J23TS9]